MSEGALQTGSEARPIEGISRGRRRVRRRRVVSPTVATFLSFLWPGLGNAYARQHVRAALFALPPLLLLIAAAIAVAADPTTFALSLLAPSFALLVIAAIAVHATWRIVAIFDAWRTTRGWSRHLLDRHLPLAVLLSVVVVVSHGAAGVFVQSFADAGEKIFTGDRPDGGSPIDDILGGGPAIGPGDGTGALPGDTNKDGVVDWNDDGWIEDEEAVPPEDDSDGDGVVDGEDDEDDTHSEPGPTFNPALTPPPLDEDEEPTPTSAPPATPTHGTVEPTSAPNPTPPPVAEGPTPPPVAEGPSGDLPSEGPINVLFVGLDSGFGRNHSLSDTMMVASYFPGRDRVTMISIPRDMGRVPLYKGGIYPRRMNTFLNYAGANPHLFPEGPVAALMKQVGYLLGIKVHFYAATNLEGLPRAVDAVGGVTITVTKAIHSIKSNYHLEPGTYHFNGTEALKYARVRYGSSDFARARRQQQIIRALALRVREPSVALNLPSVINALTEVVRTNVPRSQAATFLRILERANDASAEHVVLAPSRYARRVDIGYYMIEPNIAAIGELSRRVFGPYSRY